MRKPFGDFPLKMLCAAVLGLGLPTALMSQGAPGPTPVTVVTLKAQDVTLTATLPGRIVASGVAEVRPQVSGILTDRMFDEGASVSQGDTMYQIDPAVYEAHVAQADAAVAQAQASVSATEKETERVQELLTRSVASQQALDDAIAARDSARAALLVAKAQLQAAEIDLERTTIRAPISGEVGLSQATRGALVTAGQAEPLTVIRQLDPVYLDVTASAAQIIRWRRGQISAELGSSDPTVTMTLADGLGYDFTGKLTAAEPHVDEKTGVAVLRMQFPNPDLILLPGMYAQVDMPTGIAKDVFLVPQEGVSRDRRGQAVALFVGENDVVEKRILTVLGDRDNAWIVSDGVRDGDRLIVAGLQKIAEGATVAPSERASEPQASASADQGTAPAPAAQD
ncbi:efflux RND transporter periplasmic adaptor subunit [Sedimentitalea xiamensis]